MKEQAKSYNYLKVCSLNANRSNAAMHAAMHSITDSQSPAFNLFLVQEPWWEKINQTHATVSFPGWQAILLKRPLRNDERPRVAAYFRQDAQLDITLRSDVISDPDVMILEIRKEGSNKPHTQIINLYNQKPLEEQLIPGWTFNRLINTHLEINIPTIITGDWNTCHLNWDDGANTPDLRTRETVEWLEGNGFMICNEPFIPMREDNAGHASVINLTFKNAAANGSNILTGHHIDTAIGALSDKQGRIHRCN